MFRRRPWYDFPFDGNFAHGKEANVKIWEMEGGARLLVRVDRGEEMMEALRAVAREKKVEAARVTGIGALRDMTLGYFDLDRKEYVRGELSGSWELLSLSGNLSLRDGEPIPHIHVIVGDAGLNVRGGHLFSGTVSVTGEIFIDRLPAPLHREMDPEVSLPLLDR
ncbi:MAG: DUF296 domain-containing protein [Candidatus Eisenbacteria bacterium]|nr:DUF296 domain-containing protein [Candidatus Eisenbacteria bacterium]